MKKDSKPKANLYREKSIGIVGGVGPYAGIDLMAKILAQTRIKSEQDHLPVTLLSYAHKIGDRTEYLLGRIEENPANELFKVIQKMAKIGVSVAAIACNTAHVPKIYSVVKEKLAASGYQMKLVHIVEASIDYLKESYPEVKRVGILATSGTYTFQLYEEYAEKAGLTAIRMPEHLQGSLVHASIYDSEYGIKTTSPGINPLATKQLKEAANKLIEQVAEASILGCTEIPLALTEKKMGETFLIDPNWVLARALITEFDPDKLSA